MACLRPKSQRDLLRNTFLGDSRLYEGRFCGKPPSMARIDFYHLQQARLEDALPRLLERTLHAQKRALVVAGSEDRVEDLAMALWSERDTWVPHGSKRDGYVDEQPIWLTEQPDENPNGATYLFLCDGADSPLVGQMERTFDLFDGHDPDRVQAARQRWKAHRAAGHELHYWQQSDRGAWQKKA